MKAHSLDSKHIFLHTKLNYVIKLTIIITKWTLSLTQPHKTGS